MKLIKTLQKFKPRLLNNHADLKPLFSLCILLLLGVAIWVYGPLVHWKNVAPLATQEKRFYAILVLCLAWVLKFLWLDLATPNPFANVSGKTEASIRALQKHFNQILQFLKKSTVMSQGKLMRLNKLPWFLLVGPENAGKTALVVNSTVNYVLHQHAKSPNAHKIEPTENCRWWVTRDITIVDVPGKFLNDTSNTKSILWTYFLSLMSTLRGKQKIGGIILALPFPDIMKQNDSAGYQRMLDQLCLRLEELTNLLPEPIPVFLIITKCDLLTGFSEFFAESNDSEIAQSWGTSLPIPGKNEKLHHLFAARFNLLIKRINQQLLWRMHQERNPRLRPLIKDFPLQVERLKECCLTFIKKYSSTLSHLPLRGVYLTSALQIHSELKFNLLDTVDQTSQHSIQLLKEPIAPSRAYFIRQVINQVLVSRETLTVKLTNNYSWKTSIAYAVAAAFVTLTAIFLGKDFKVGVEHAHAVQNTLAAYQVAVQKIQDPEDHLDKTLALLNALQQGAKIADAKINLAYFLSFYSRESMQKTITAYHNALESVFIPEMKSYLGEYLQNAVNKDDGLTYSTLEAYIMLSDPKHADPAFITRVLQATVLPQMNADKAAEVSSHLHYAFAADWQTTHPSDDTIDKARRYLTSKPSVQLAYIILRNITGNNAQSPINLGTNLGDTPALICHQAISQIPSMYTAKVFADISDQEIAIAANEATTGNWVLGNIASTDSNSAAYLPLVEQLRALYISNYVGMWENIVANIQLTEPKNLAQTHDLLISLGNDNSPLLQLLKTLHDNTYFEPIASYSPKLKNLGVLTDKNNPSDTSLFQVFSGLQAAHQYIQTILTDNDEKKAAFNAISIRLKGDVSDPISQLRIMADKYPDPLKSWLVKMTDYAWRYLMTDASQYIDTSWQNQVAPFYQKEIATRYPFNASSNQAIDLKTFIAFFGNPGVVANFYMNYLSAFVDTSTANWRWKSLGSTRPPFPDETLQQVQYAVRIDHAMFPNGHSAKAVKNQMGRMAAMNLDYFHFPLRLVDLQK